MRRLVSWFEIPAIDFDRAVAFYGALFEVELRSCDCGDEQMAFFPEQAGEVSGMISRAKGFNPSADGVVVYFDATGKLDELVGRVVELGGKVLMGKTEIDAEGRGSFALVCDTEGNRFGFYAP